MANKDDMKFEIAKLQVREAIRKLCIDRELGGGSYDRIVLGLFLEGLPAYANLANTNVSGYLRKLADYWDATENYNIDMDNVQ